MLNWSLPVTYKMLHVAKILQLKVGCSCSVTAANGGSLSLRGFTVC